MILLRNILLLTFFHTYHCDTAINNLFENINENILKFNQLSAEIAWDSSVNPDNTDLIFKATNYQNNRIIWQQSTCNNLATLFQNHLLNSTQERQTYLLCRGPNFSFEEARKTSNLYKQLQEIYNAEICVPTKGNISLNDVSDKESIILDYLSIFKENIKFYKQLPSKNMSLLAKDQRISLAAKLGATTKRSSESDLCLKGEVDFDELMASSKDEEILRWLWLVWREKTGPPMRQPYKRLVGIENMAARRNGYQNIGASWRDELEIPNLRTFCRKLYESIRPLYTLLHGVVRFHLRRFYGDVVPEKGPIPAHLLGNLWSQNWEHLSDLLIKEDVNFDNNIKKLNWTVTHMVKRAEDYYQSLGLPAMTDKFWRESIFARENNAAKCHGAAADMFKNGDFRLLYCSRTTKDDFYVLHHEFGHIQYYMAYKNQPTLFRQANSALHETIGDTIMYGVTTPQHLHRLGLITDSQLYSTNSKEKSIEIDYKEIPNSNEVGLDSKFKKHIQIEKSDNNMNLDPVLNIGDRRSWWKYILNNNLEREFKMTKYDDKFKKIYKKPKSVDTFENMKNTNFQFNLQQNSYNHLRTSNTPKSDIKMKLNIDEILLLKQALNKIPQIPFSLLIDSYRWKYFEGSLKKPNDHFWKLSLELQGIFPPDIRGEAYFDAGAKFHVPDNTPYIRYFLSSFLQHQLFESLCKTAVFGRRDVNESLPETIALNRCDLYGSKAVGKVLIDIMSRGHSQHWKEILNSTVNIFEISSNALKRYYRPLEQLLMEHVKKYRIPIGW